MHIDKKLAFIGGGNMAEAIISGLLDKLVIERTNITVLEKRPERCVYLEKYGIRAVTDEIESIKNADIIVLAIKPQQFAEVVEQLRPVRPDSLVISILAGTRIERIEQALGGPVRVVRVMPNTPALVGEGMAGISAGTNATEDDITVTKFIFDQLGKSVIVPEPMLDLVTGVSGSGPAYVFYCIEALTEAAIQMGMREDQAQLLVAQTFKGAVELLISSGESAAELRKKVTSKGGTTEQGLAVLTKHDMKKIFFETVQAATNRSVELSQNA